MKHIFINKCYPCTATLDSLLCSDQSVKVVNKMCSEIYKVLKPGGKFIMISYAKKQSRSIFLQKPEFSWSMEVATLKKPVIPLAPNDEETSNHYLYVLTKDR